jgi:LysM repeat protein
VRAFGNASGNSTSSYDANKVRSRLDLGQGDAQTRPEFKTFVSDNEGHIIFEFHDDGESAARAEIEYAYANGNPVGETGPRTTGETKTELDTGRYALIANLGEDFPEGNLTYTARDGDTLQGIAATMYGNPSLWFVIADANGLNSNEPIKAGTQLTIPNTIKTGHLTNDTHKVYSESEIVGSTLPNLKSPPPPKPKKGCGNILAIIIVVVIAVVVAYFTAGAGLSLLSSAGVGTFTTVGAAFAAAPIATTLALAVAGAAVAAVGSIVQQGLFIALGYQDKFSWKDVGTAAVAGAFSGAATAVGAGAKAAQVAADLGKAAGSSATYLRVAAAALRVAGAASKQLLSAGKITSWTSLAATALGQSKVGFDEAGNDVILEGFVDSDILTYTTPWVELAETYVRSDGKLTPTDWANAVGSTLSSAVTSEKADAVTNAFNRLGTNLIVAGALSHFDRDAAQSYLENAIGQEAGQYIGDYLGQRAQSFFAAQLRERQRQEAQGVRLDQNGNPTPVMLASLRPDDIMSDAGPGFGVPTTGTPAPSEEAERMAQIMAGMLAEGAPSTASGYMVDDTGAPILGGESEMLLAQAGVSVDAGDRDEADKARALLSKALDKNLDRLPAATTERLNNLLADPNASASDILGAMWKNIYQDPTAGLIANARNPFELNQIISRTYGEIWRADPDTLWFAGGAFASSAVGEQLGNLQLGRELPSLVETLTKLAPGPTVTREDMEVMFQNLPIGNKAIFMDMVPTYSLYQDLGYAGLAMAGAFRPDWETGKRDPVSALALQGYEYRELADQTRDPEVRKNYLRQSVLSLAEHEQVNVLQPVLYDKPGVADTVQRYQDSILGPIKINMAGEPLEFPGGNFADVNQRMPFVNQALNALADIYFRPATWYRHSGQSQIGVSMDMRLYPERYRANPYLYR